MGRGEGEGIERQREDERTKGDRETIIKNINRKERVCRLLENREHTADPQERLRCSPLWSQPSLPSTKLTSSLAMSLISSLKNFHQKSKVSVSICRILLKESFFFFFLNTSYSLFDFRTQTLPPRKTTPTLPNKAEKEKGSLL